MKEYQLICSYTSNAYISTAWIPTITIEGECWLFETIAFAYDIQSKKIGDILKQRDSGTNKEYAIRSHFDVVNEVLFPQNEE